MNDKQNFPIIFAFPGTSKEEEKYVRFGEKIKTSSQLSYQIFLESEKPSSSIRLPAPKSPLKTPMPSTEVPEVPANINIDGRCVMYDLMKCR